jgi:glycerol-3-phosphate O-acyltransferase
MDAVVGLPQFTYGAGLNLYNTGYTAYFMNRLGAYRLDRRKKNPIYLETLKTMSNLAVQRGTNSLFFPGGTRSRSGAMEKELKKGLLGSVVEAQRDICGRADNNKIYVVPLIIGYHFVLEAEFLIESYLKLIGKEHYIAKEKDQSYSVRKWLRFGWSFFSRSLLGNQWTYSATKWMQKAEALIKMATKLISPIILRVKESSSKIYSAIQNIQKS